MALCGCFGKTPSASGTDVVLPNGDYSVSAASAFGGTASAGKGAKRDGAPNISLNPLRSVPRLPVNTGNEPKPGGLSSAVGAQASGVLPPVSATVVEPNPMTTFGPDVGTTTSSGGGTGVPAWKQRQDAAKAASAVAASNASSAPTDAWKGRALAGPPAAASAPPVPALAAAPVVAAAALAAVTFGPVPGGTRFTATSAGVGVGHGGLTGCAPTDSHAVALQAKVERMRDEIRRRIGAGPKVFRDTTFEGDAALGRPFPDCAPGDWVRLRDLHPAGLIVEDGFAACDIKQGRLGDCYFLSALAVLADRNQAILEKMLVTPEYDPTGLYAVRFWRDGAWAEVLVDDRLPVLRDMYQYADRDGLFKGAADATTGRYPRPLMVCSSTRSEFWMSLVEKAYAKLNGSYAAIERGQVHLALSECAPGSFPEAIDLQAPALQADASAQAELYWRVKRMHQEGHLLGAGSQPGNEHELTAGGIVKGHAYSVLDFAELEEAASSSGGGETHLLVQLRNPWGRGEWAGAWSDADAARWTPAVCARLDYYPNGIRPGATAAAAGAPVVEDGVFVMAWRDFVREFYSLYVCRVYRCVADGGTWHRYTARGEWKGQTAGGCPNTPESAQWNPQYALQVVTRTRLIVSLAQLHVPGSSAAAIETILFKVVDKGGRRVKRAAAKDTLLGPTALPVRQLCGEVTLEPRPHPYTLFVSTFAPGREAGFVVTVYADAPLASTDGEALRLIPTSVEAV